MGGADDFRSMIADKDGLLVEHADAARSGEPDYKVHLAAGP